MDEIMFAKYVDCFESQLRDWTELWVLDPSVFTPREAALIEIELRRRHPNHGLSIVLGPPPTWPIRR